MKNKFISFALVLVLAISIFGMTASAAVPTAAPTASTVYINGASKSFEAYNIGGNNFFKLRDLAFALNGTHKQFEVGYDVSTREITLTSGEPYTPVGGEMTPGDGQAKPANPTLSKIYLDVKELNFIVYNIGGNNFFMLRDLMEALDVFVGYNATTKAITLDTNKGYIPENRNGQYLGELQIGLVQTLIISEFTALGFRFEFLDSGVSGVAEFSDDGYAYYYDSTGQAINFRLAGASFIVGAGYRYGSLAATYILQDTTP